MTAITNKHSFGVWVSWDMSEAAYTTDDMMDALTVFANTLKTCDGMHVEVRTSDGKVIAAYPVEKQPEYEQFHIGQQVEVIAGYYSGNKGTVIHLQPQPDGAAIVQVQWRNNHTKYIPSFALADNTTLQQGRDELQVVPAYIERSL